MKKKIETTAAPGAIGPYSQGVDIGNLVFTSGQLGIDPATNILPESIEEQTCQALRNVEAVLADAGLTMTDIVKTLVFVRSMADFGIVNNIYAKFICGDVLPARSCVETSALPKGALVEIEVIASRS